MITLNDTLEILFILSLAGIILWTVFDKNGQAMFRYTLGGFMSYILRGFSFIWGMLCVITFFLLFLFSPVLVLMVLGYYFSL